MRRMFMTALCAGALACAGAFTWCLGAPAFRGQVGPCRVTVHCPGGEAVTTYQYNLVGRELCRGLRIAYDPARPEADGGAFENLPPGEYRLLENGGELCRVWVTAEEPWVEIFPDDRWPIAPPQ